MQVPRPGRGPAQLAGRMGIQVARQIVHGNRYYVRDDQTSTTNKFNDRKYRCAEYKRGANNDGAGPVMHTSIDIQTGISE